MDVGALAQAVQDLTEQNRVLQDQHRHVVAMNRMALEVAMRLRAAGGLQESLDSVCQVLGEVLEVDRVLLSTADDDRGGWSRGAQWCRTGLEPTVALSPELLEMTAAIAEQLWMDIGAYPVADLYSPDSVDPGKARTMAEALPARAALVVPVGVGGRVIGLITAVMTDRTRKWTPAEVNAVQQVSAYLARTVTQREHAAQQERFVEQLQRLDQQKTDFMATVSHELRTPLTSIAGYLEILRDGDLGAVSPEQDHVLGVMHRNTTRLRGLIEDLLVLNRIESSGLDLSFRPIVIGELVVRAVESLKPMSDRAGVQLRCPPAPATAVVSGDADQLERALTNVLSNAVKFTPAQGHVEVDVVVRAECVQVTCQDTGIGIPEADMDQLFTRFFRASNATAQTVPGTGLGLAIVEAIVESHRGSLQLTSVEGEGTCVVTTLPRPRPGGPTG